MKPGIAQFLRRHSLWAFFILAYGLNILITFTQLYNLKIPQAQLVAILQVLTHSMCSALGCCRPCGYTSAGAG